MTEQELVKWLEEYCSEVSTLAAKTIIYDAFYKNKISEENKNYLINKIQTNDTVKGISTTTH